MEWLFFSIKNTLLLLSFSIKLFSSISFFVEFLGLESAYAVAVIISCNKKSVSCNGIASTTCSLNASP